MTGYTRVDNWLFDVVMPAAAPYTFKVVTAVVRQTTGWNRSTDEISISQFQEMIGANSRTTTTKAIQDALDNGWIARDASGQGYIYWTTSTDNGLVTSPESVLEASPENGHTKEKNKDIVKELADHFHAETGLFATLDDWDDKWAAPLHGIYERAGSVPDAKVVITESVKFAREGPKRYTLKNPMSINTIAANLEVNGSGHAVKVGTR